MSYELILHEVNEDVEEVRVGKYETYPADQTIQSDLVRYLMNKGYMLVHLNIEYGDMHFVELIRVDGMHQGHTAIYELRAIQ